MTPPVISFRELSREDCARLATWLNRPHVYPWWGYEQGEHEIGGPGEHATDEEQTAAKYGPGGSDPAHRYVIEVDGEPIGMIQWYATDDDPLYARELAQPGTASIDLLIGEPDRIGGGLGPEIIRRFTEDVVLVDSQFRRVLGCPDVRNRRSIRAFEKAGYRWVADAIVTGVPAPEHVMVFDRPEHLGG